MDFGLDRGGFGVAPSRDRRGKDVGREAEGKSKDKQGSCGPSGSGPCGRVGRRRGEFGPVCPTFLVRGAWAASRAEHSRRGPNAVNCGRPTPVGRGSRGDVVGAMGRLRPMVARQMPALVSVEMFPARGSWRGSWRRATASAVFGSEAPTRSRVVAPSGSSRPSCGRAHRLRGLYRALSGQTADRSSTDLSCDDCTPPMRRRRGGRSSPAGSAGGRTAAPAISPWAIASNARLPSDRGIGSGSVAIGIRSARARNSQGVGDGSTLATLRSEPFPPREVPVGEGRDAVEMDRVDGDRAAPVERPQRLQDDGPDRREADRGHRADRLVGSPCRRPTPRPGPWRARDRAGCASQTWTSQPQCRATDAKAGRGAEPEQAEPAARLTPRAAGRDTR